jgi:hypothetical protein
MFGSLRAKYRENQETTVQIVQLSEARSGTYRAVQYRSAIAGAMVGLGFYLSWLLATGYYTEGIPLGGYILFEIVFALPGFLLFYCGLYVIWYYHKYVTPAEREVRERRKRANEEIEAEIGGDVEV